MLKKIALGAAALIAVLLVLAYLNRETLFIAMMAGQIAPEHDFAENLAPPAPDYTDAGAWAATPASQDAADDRPAGAESQALPVGVFFVHPTSYMKKANWNQPIDDAEANWVVDERVLRHQASVFNGCCEVYAPRYRQATFFSFIDQSGNGTAALDLAYSDVVRAFDAFLSRNGEQPFIIAGHSQGSSHTARLLRERIAGTPLQDRLVAAYLIGFSIEKDQTGGIPVCDHAAATGCVIGWNAVDGPAAGIFPDAEALICTNPLTWEDDGSYAGHDLNQGGIGYLSYGPPEDGEDVTAMIVEPGAADAECRDGMLSVPELRSERFPSRMPGSSMHIYDYSLFYLNLRKNAVQRARAFLMSADAMNAPAAAQATF